MKIGGHDVVGIAKRTFKEFREDDLQGAAAEIAYHILFAIVPLMIFLTALTGFVSQQIGVNNVMDDITSWLRDNLPDETANVVVDPIERVLETPSGGLLSFGALAALWGGKNAMATLMKGLNIAFDAKESRPWWRKQLVAIGLTLALGGAIVLASIMFVIGATGGAFLADLVGLDETWATVWSLLQWPLVVALLLIGLAAFYWAAPNVNTEFKWLTPGSVLAVAAWAIATVGLSYYFANFAGYTAYGALGAVMAFVFWLYVMSLILLLGGELNAVIGRVTGTVVPEVPLDYGNRGAAAGVDSTESDGMDRRRADAADRTPQPASGGAGFVQRDDTSDRAVLADPDEGGPDREGRAVAARAVAPRRGINWRRVGGLMVAAGVAGAERLGLRRRAQAPTAAVSVPPLPGAAGVEPPEPAPPLTRAALRRLEERTVGELRAAVDAGIFAKTELQIYGLDWSQLAAEPDHARLADVFARHGGVVDPGRGAADDRIAAP